MSILKKSLDEADKEAEDPNTKYYTHEEMKKNGKEDNWWRIANIQ